MRRTLASPILAISSNNPSAIFADALSASIRTARRGERSSAGMTFPKWTRQRRMDIPMLGRLPPDLIFFQQVATGREFISGWFLHGGHASERRRQFGGDIP